MPQTGYFWKSWLHFSSLNHSVNEYKAKNWWCHNGFEHWIIGWMYEAILGHWPNIAFVYLVIHSDIASGSCRIKNAGWSTNQTYFATFIINIQFTNVNHNTWTSFPFNQFHFGLIFISIFVLCLDFLKSSLDLLETEFFKS